MSDLLVYRGVPTPDRNNDPRMPPADEWPLWKTIPGAEFAPGASDEPLPVAANTVTTVGTIYLRGVTDTGILATDEVEVDGGRYVVDGVPAVWPLGTVVRVKAVS